MSLAQFLILVLIVVVFWLASKLKKQGQELDELKSKISDEQE